MCSNVDVIKKIIKGKGRDVIEQRNERRQRLIEKFKSLRIQAVDNFRNLKENEFTYEVLCDLRKEILSTLDKGSLVEVQDVDYFLEDLEEELRVMEGEQYDKLCFEEIEAITNLMNKCEVCENLITENGICRICAQKHFTSQF